jgi:hypothetical protein
VAVVYLFYGVDMARLRGLHGSADRAFAEELLKEQAEEFQSINDTAESYTTAQKKYPSAETILREILDGSCRQGAGAWWMYRSVLQALCDHISTFIADGAGLLDAHPYDSALLASGPPVPIPVDPHDRTRIGFLLRDQIPAEIQRLDTAPKRARRRWRLNWWTLWHARVYGPSAPDEWVAEDMADYHEILTDALNQDVDLVGFYCP